MPALTVPHPIQYQGSKRLLAPMILRFLPDHTPRLVEPFAGTAAVSVACAAARRADHYWLNDFNKPLADLLSLVINTPGELADRYRQIWMAQAPDSLEHYYRARAEFNSAGDPALFLYLLARCVKGSIRYNSDGLFNQSPDKRRRGAHPDTMRRNIMGVSALLRGRTVVTALDYKEVLASVGDNDVIYMDPPYQGVCGDRDSRYLAGIDHDEFAESLAALNRRNARYIVSYDGRLGERAYGRFLPAGLNLKRIELEVGRSSQATLLGRDEVTIESLYLSPALVKQLPPTRITLAGYHQSPQQLHLLESDSHHAKAEISPGIS